MCFLGGCPPVGSDVHLGADIELGPIETVAGSSLGFLRASRTRGAVPGGCGVMVVLLGMVSTGRSALATTERNGARLATDVSSALEEGPTTTRSATPPDTHPGEEAQPGKRCEDVFEGLRAGPGTEGEVALRSAGGNANVIVTLKSAGALDQAGNVGAVSSSARCSSRRLACHFLTLAAIIGSGVILVGQRHGRRGHLF